MSAARPLATQPDDHCELRCLSPGIDALLAEIMGHEARAFSTLSPKTAVYRCVGHILHKGIWLRERVGAEIQARLSHYLKEEIFVLICTKALFTRS